MTTEQVDKKKKIGVDLKKKSCKHINKYKKNN